MEERGGRREERGGRSEKRGERTEGEDGMNRTSGQNRRHGPDEPTDPFPYVGPLTFEILVQ